MLRFAWLLLCCLLGVHSIDFAFPQSYTGFHNGYSPRLGGRNSLFESTIPSFGFGQHNFGQSSFDAPNFGGADFGGGNFGSNSPQPNPPQPNPGCGTAPAGACQKTRYRSYDGTCNNLRNPVLGTPNSPYTRLLGPK